MRSQSSWGYWTQRRGEALNMGLKLGSVLLVKLLFSGEIYLHTPPTPPLLFSCSFGIPSMDTDPLPQNRSRQTEDSSLPQTLPWPSRVGEGSNEPFHAGLLDSAPTSGYFWYCLSNFRLVDWFDLFPKYLCACLLGLQFSVVPCCRDAFAAQLSQYHGAKKLCQVSPAVLWASAFVC